MYIWLMERRPSFNNKTRIIFRNEILKDDECTREYILRSVSSNYSAKNMSRTVSANKVQEEMDIEKAV
ncbi:UNVERIFIED_CONTAM: hypothetical protein RMT77_004205 [Armadillidium vulgare]